MQLYPRLSMLDELFFKTFFKVGLYGENKRGGEKKLVESDKIRWRNNLWKS